ncbi:hypothetical protein [Mucilaginibacter sp.]|uniref:hypothetical protein n=1 Tax=Mucilaginibacter sp. TaxID=1882438 RepID=UPI00262787D1|nr:hypothetical protein [Mucilaginibacter sp.]MDB4922819.1 hypothetical protein [Mucilaginibacter sp.]
MLAILAKILSFIQEIGLSYKLEPIDNTTFLPGLRLSQGIIIIDNAKLLYPGDILHEAGHLATMPPEIRETMSDNLENNDLNRGGELMALAWSYAASVHLNLDPGVVFHPNGYKGSSENLINIFTNGGDIGVPMLQWTGMTYDVRTAKELDAKPFPHMICWLRKN